MAHINSFNARIRKLYANHNHLHPITGYNRQLYSAILYSVRAPTYKVLTFS